MARGDAPGRLIDYAGRGPLGAWVRIAAVRLAIDIRRKRSAPEQGEADETDSCAPGDPEDDYSRAQSASAFRRALGQAVDMLSADERTLLRLHYLDGLSIDDVGVAMSVHRSTVARWLSHARESVLRETWRLLRAEVRLEDADLRSLLDTALAETDGSLGRILATAEV
jgi:RNA polymerase sigma-70 factor (ECF subfamily)